MKNLLNTPEVQDSLKLDEQLKGDALIDTVKEGYREYIELTLLNKERYYTDNNLYLFDRDQAIAAFDDKRAAEIIAYRIENNLPIN